MHRRFRAVLAAALLLSLTAAALAQGLGLGAGVDDAAIRRGVGGPPAPTVLLTATGGNLLTATGGNLLIH